MNKKKYYKNLFIIVAIWNFMVSLPLFIASLIDDSIFALFNIQIPNSLIWLYLFYGFVFIYGIGYFLVSRDISKNHGIILMGAIAKSMVLLSFIVYWFLAEISTMILILGIIDSIFVCLFIEFLLNYKKL